MITEEIVKYITSQNRHKIWGSACEIIDSGQDSKKIESLIEYLPLIKGNMINLNLSGGFAPNQRFIDFAIKTIEFHKNKKCCTCALFIEKYKLTNDIVNREFNTNVLILKNNLKKEI